MVTMVVCYAEWLNHLNKTSSTGGRDAFSKSVAGPDILIRASREAPLMVGNFHEKTDACQVGFLCSLLSCEFLPFCRAATVNIGSWRPSKKLLIACLWKADGLSRPVLNPSSNRPASIRTLQNREAFLLPIEIEDTKYLSNTRTKYPYCL
jgi:hypothetical protein